MSFKIFRTCFFIFLMAATLPVQAQNTIGYNDSASAAALPNAPTTARVSAGPPQSADQYPRTQQIPVHTHPGIAPRLAKYIEPDQHAVPLSSKDKLELSVWEQVQPYAISTEIMAAGWEHLLDSNPHYGSDKAGFGERLGAAAIRQTSQAVFSDGVFAAVLHQDPRYYRKGSGSIVGRIAYSATRVIITRTDSGNEAPNYSQMLGYAGASALTMTYYPAVSATWSNTTEGYVISLAASALGNQVHEFTPDLLHLLHRHRY